MGTICKTLVAAAVSLLALAGVVLAQSAIGAGTTSQSEMNRGVPGADVDVGRNARGAVDMDVGRPGNGTGHGVPGVDVDADSNARGAMEVDRTRAPPTATDGLDAGGRPSRSQRPIAVAGLYGTVRRLSPWAGPLS